MIQPQELRIGNWVDVKMLNGSSNITRTQFGFDLLKYVHLCEPIPLSPEILEKAGLKPDSDYDGLYSFGGYNFDLTDGVVVCLINLEYKIGAPAHYLHQLQNLIYALTGEELNIQL